MILSGVIRKKLFWQDKSTFGYSYLNNLCVFVVKQTVLNSTIFFLMFLSQNVFSRCLKSQIWRSISKVHAIHALCLLYLSKSVGKNSVRELRGLVFRITYIMEIVICKEKMVETVNFYILSKRSSC